MSTPQEVFDALGKLGSADQDTIKSYIHELQTEIAQLKGEEAPTPMDEVEDEAGNEPAFPPLYAAGDDMDKAAELKMHAADMKSEKKWDQALELYTAAILCAPPSSLLYANRAFTLLQLDRPRAAERDCTEALLLNPDSAAALRIRGKARLHQEKWEGARDDLSQAQTIDFDEGSVDDLKVALEECKELEHIKTEHRLMEEQKLKKRAEEIKKAREEAKVYTSPRASAAPAGMGGMPAGLMESLASDPELAAAMQNPKVMAAFSSLMSEPGGPASLLSNPAKMQELMADPDVGPVLMKLMSKLGGGAMGGMPWGTGGMPQNHQDDDEMPDLDDLPDLE